MWVKYNKIKNMKKQDNIKLPSIKIPTTPITVDNIKDVLGSIRKYKPLFDFSRSIWRGESVPIKIICKKHNKLFHQTVKSLFKGEILCPECRKELGLPPIPKKCKDWKILLGEFRKVHGDRFEYPNLEEEYTHTHVNIKIKCNVCGHLFEQQPHDHLIKEQGCPKCNYSKLERKIELFLIREGYKYIPLVRKSTDKKFEFLERQSYDFFLPDYNIAIECQGKQHFIPTAFGGKSPEEHLEYVINLDKIKIQKSKEHKIKLIHVVDEKVKKQYVPKNWSLYDVVSDISELKYIIDDK